MGCATLHNTGVVVFFFVFKDERRALWCFNTLKKGSKDERKKKAKLYFTSGLKGSLSLFADPRLQHFLGLAEARLKLGDMF